LIADDAFAASFQSLGQYRTALLAALAQPEPQGPDLTACDLLERFIDYFWDEQDAESFPNAAALVAQARAFLTQPEPQGSMPEVDDILRLAAIIRRVDGNHDKGAAALAEAILSHPDSRWQHAQPEPQGPTDEELKNLANKAWISVDVLKEYDLIENAFDCCGFARAVLARWGRPAIEPVPVSERLPGPEDCDAEGRCWWWNVTMDPDSPNWWSLESIEYIETEPYWLPRWALPVPVVEGADA
jgi:hypothetical protein